MNCSQSRHTCLAPHFPASSPFRLFKVKLLHLPASSPPCPSFRSLSVLLAVSRFACLIFYRVSLASRVSRLPSRASRLGPQLRAVVKNSNLLSKYSLSLLMSPFSLEFFVIYFYTKFLNLIQRSATPQNYYTINIYSKIWTRFRYIV